MIQFLDQKLYHISENPDIEHFQPRLDRNGKKCVWAINAHRIQNYLLPRDCPRICIWADERTNDQDQHKLRRTNSIIAIERAWFEQAESTTLYAYMFDSDGFELEDANAGYFTSNLNQTSTEVFKIEDPLRQMNRLGARLEVLEELHSFKETVLASSYAYSMIRMRNAAPIQPMQT